MVVFCFMFVKDRSFSLTQVSRPMLISALEQCPNGFPPINSGNPLLQASVTPYRIGEILPLADTPLPIPPVYRESNLFSSTPLLTRDYSETAYFLG